MISFTKEINRRLILPPLIHYESGKIELIPFEQIFDINQLSKFLDVTTPAKYEMAKIKTLFCFKQSMEKNSPFPCQNCSDKNKGCNLHGNPIVPFWKQLNVTFENSQMLENVYPLTIWDEIETNPIALFGAILPFPAPNSLNFIHKYIKFRYIFKPY